MKFEKLTDNKIKITLGIKDLEEKNIDFHSFMSNTMDSQDLFLDILKEAENKIGFITNNYNIHIEAFATSDGTFILTITRMSTINLPKSHTVKYKRKSLNTNAKLAIYTFDSFNDYCSFCTFLHRYIKKINNLLDNASLIMFNSKYYLVLFNINIIKLKNFFSYLSEFANYCSNSERFASRLLEYGEILLFKNAIEVGINYLR